MTYNIPSAWPYHIRSHTEGGITQKQDRDDARVFQNCTSAYAQRSGGQISESALETAKLGIRIRCERGHSMSSPPDHLLDRANDLLDGDFFEAAIISAGCVAPVVIARSANEIYATPDDPDPRRVTDLFRRISRTEQRYDSSASDLRYVERA